MVFWFACFTLCWFFFRINVKKKQTCFLNVFGWHVKQVQAETKGHLCKPSAQCELHKTNKAWKHENVALSILTRRQMNGYGQKVWSSLSLYLILSWWMCQCWQPPSLFILDSLFYCIVPLKSPHVVVIGRYGWHSFMVSCLEEFEIHLKSIHDVIVIIALSVKVILGLHSVLTFFTSTTGKNCWFASFGLERWSDIGL